MSALTLAEQLAGSLDMLAAIERIDVLESAAHCRADARCACDSHLREHTEVLDLYHAIPLRPERVCSIECAAYALLWQLHPTQDQSAESVRRVMALIERSFERARREVACGDCGAPEPRQCECGDAGHEPDSDETLGLRRDA